MKTDFEYDGSEFDMVVDSETGERTIAEVGGDNRPAPEPLYKTPPQETYPIDSLPDVMKASIEEAHKDNKAAIPLISAGHHYYLSYATQGLAMVRRGARMVGPIGTFFLCVAVVNARKSTNDKLFSPVVSEYVKAEKARMGIDIEALASNESILDSKISGVKERIKALTKKEEGSFAQEEKLRKLISERNSLPPVYVPSLPLVDVTRQYVVKHLCHHHPSAAIITAEGGRLLHSYAFDPKHIAATIHTWCDLWSGEAVDSRTVGRGVDIATGGKLTVGLMIQPKQFERFLSKHDNGELLYESGFLARTFFTTAGLPDADDDKEMETTPDVDKFKHDLTALFETKLKFDDEGLVLTPPEMGLSKNAHDHYKEYVKAARKSGGDEDTYRSRFMGKAAENAARLACQYQLLENIGSATGGRSDVSKENMVRATTLADWYANEQARYFEEVDMPQELQDAKKVDEWLAKEAAKKGKRVFSKTTIRDHTNVKERGSLNDALSCLEERNRISIKKGKGRAIDVEYLVRK